MIYFFEKEGQFRQVRFTWNDPIRSRASTRLVHLRPSAVRNRFGRQMGRGPARFA
jgi:hypothetical protein